MPSTRDGLGERADSYAFHLMFNGSTVPVSHLQGMLKLGKRWRHLMYTFFIRCVLPFSLYLFRYTTVSVCFMNPGDLAWRNQKRPYFLWFFCCAFMALFLLIYFFVDCQYQRKWMMVVICAWCQQEGQRGILEITGEKADERQSHGICQYHSLRLRHEYRRSFFPATLPILSHQASSNSLRHCWKFFLGIGFAFSPNPSWDFRTLLVFSWAWDNWGREGQISQVDNGGTFQKLWSCEKRPWAHLPQSLWQICRKRLRCVQKCSGLGYWVHYV